MISRKQEKYINSLKLSKFRHISRTFIAEGPKLFDEIIQSELEIESIFALKNFLDKKDSILRDHEVYEITEKELARVSTLKTPNQVILVLRIPEFDIDWDDMNKNLVLALHDIRDPGNMGTIIRTADWFGIRQIICSKECVDIYNPKVVQATMGSISRVRVHYLNMGEFLHKHSSELTVFGAMLDGDNIYDEILPDKGIIMVGNESQGIPEGLGEYIQKKVSIPSGATSTESLNASIATAIILSEFRRQKPLLKKN